MSFKNEKEMQTRIGSIIRSGGLASHIIGGDALRGLLDESEHVLPVFSIDKLARNAMIRAALGCLDRLHDISVLTDDLNVSAVKYETLRPDLSASPMKTKRFGSSS
jgi:hypothetical protein